MSPGSQVPLRVAFIGGAINSAVGYTHFNATRMDGLLRVVAGCFSRHEEINRQTASLYGIPARRLHASWQELLSKEQGQLDAVVILTPTPTHAEICLAALEAGYEVICEKALATSAEECRQIGEAAACHNRFLAVTYNYSGYPMVRQLRKFVEQGRLGRLQQIHIEMPQEGFLRQGANPQPWRRTDYAIPTVSLDLGVHVHHLIDFVSGGLQPLEIMGDQASYGLVEGIVDNVYCLARYENNLRVQAWWGKTALGYRNGLRLRVFGELGSADWYQMEPEMLRTSDNDGHTLIIDRASGEAELAQETRYNRFKAGHPTGFIEAFANLYVDIADELRARKHSRQERKNSFVYGATAAEKGLHMLGSLAQTPG